MNPQPPSSAPASEPFISPQFDAARSCIQRGDLAGAELICRNIVEQQPTHFDALHLLAAIAGHSGKFPEAASWLERAVAIRPDDLGARAAFGRFLLQCPNRIESGVTQLQRVAEAAPEPALLSDLGHGLLLLGRLDDADSTLRRAI